MVNGQAGLALEARLLPLSRYKAFAREIFVVKGGAASERETCTDQDNMRGQATMLAAGMARVKSAIRSLSLWNTRRAACRSLVRAFAHVSAARYVVACRARDHRCRAERVDRRGPECVRTGNPLPASMIQG
jgi:hypothetical protein